LNGILGKKKIEVNSRGKVISDNIFSEARAGENIVLAIDEEIQSVMAESLNSYIKKYFFRGGAGAIMDVENGEILAMVSLPEYSSKILTEGKDKRQIKKYLEDKASPFLNKVLYGEFVPGSIVKPFVALMGLKNNVITANEKLYTNGSIVIANKYDTSNLSIFRD
jgi:penicillin-binding protein 2